VGNLTIVQADYSDLMSFCRLLSGRGTVPYHAHAHTVVLYL